MLAAPSPLKIRRMIAGYKQHELAELIGVAESTYSKMETGRRMPTAEQIKKLSEFLGCKPSKLLDFADIKLPSL